jgi:hypothetical protein
MKFDEKSIFFLNPPFFYFHGNCLSSNFMKLCRNIHCRVWQLLGGAGVNKFKMVTDVVPIKFHQFLFGE